MVKFMKSTKLYLRIKDKWTSFNHNENKVFSTIITLSLFMFLIVSLNIIFNSYANYMNTEINTFNKSNFIFSNNTRLEDDDYKFIDSLLLNSNATYLNSYNDFDEFHKHKYDVTGVTEDYRYTGVFTYIYQKKVIKTINLISGQHISANDENVCLISEKSAKLLFGNNPLNKVISFRNKTYKVIGVYEEYEKNIDNEEIRLIVPYNSLVTNDSYKPYGIVINSVEKDRIVRSLSTYFQSKNVMFNIDDSHSRGLEVEEYINNFFIIYVTILSLLFVILFIGIVNAITYNVKSKVYEIALRKSLGAKDSHIFRQNIFDSLLYTMCGYLLALLSSTILFVIIQMIINNINIEIPFLFKINFLDQLYLLIIFIAIAALGCLYPTYFINKQNIASQFQNE